ncbi:MAG TPA: TadE family protein [Candidatus Elarobacter sp.]|nr:TadE family protein [Candidatus Elarobacter sp.]
MRHRVVTHRARGQALIETAIALPVFLLAMFGVIWALQTGVLGERVELVARYGGMVSAEKNPYQQYSLYAAYSAASGFPLGTPCATPPPDLVQNAGPLAAPATATQAFWQPSGSATAQATCGKTLAGSGLSAPMMLGRNAVTVSATSDVPTTMQPFAGSQTQRTATMNAFHSPDMATLVGCYSELQSAFEHSADPSTDPATPDQIPAALSSYDTGPLVLSGFCG